jgi:hypothetical protein
LQTDRDGFSGDATTETDDVELLGHSEYLRHGNAEGGYAKDRRGSAALSIRLWYRFGQLTARATPSSNGSATAHVV